MTILKLIAVGLATAIRPTSLAAVAALLATGRPRRFLTAYVVVGFGFTVGFGLAVVWVLHGVDINTTSGPFRKSAEIAGGIVLFGFGLLTVLRRPSSRSDQPAGEHRDVNRWTAALKEHVTVRKAALAGPLTHLPGVLYLLALDLIITEQRSAPVSLIDVLVYNAVWFALPIAAMVAATFRPGAASRAVTAVQPWAREHGRSVLAVVCLALGAVLLLQGLLR